MIYMPEAIQIPIQVVHPTTRRAASLAQRPSSRSPDVLDGDRAGADGARGEDLVVLADVDEARARGADGAAARARLRAREGDLAEVGEGDEAVVGREVLDDPLRVVLAERGLARERVRDGLAGRLVRDRRLAGRLRGRGHGHLNRVARLEADAREVVRVVGVPLEPGWRAGDGGSALCGCSR